MKKDNTKPLLVAVLFLALVLLGVLVFGIYDVWSKEKEVSRLLNQIDQESENGVVSQSIRLIQKTAAADLIEFESLVFSDSDLVPLIEEIESIGRGFGLETNITSVDREEAEVLKSEPQTIHLTVETLGSWVETLHFLKGLESFPYRVMISEILLSKEEGVSKWNLRIALSIHSFP